ncbi:BON domain-containing protein [Luteimonas deserti]|uniref:BON domain-containing protein n=1 Tax=Luteimonas deserti TaxID=2752306 RepID=A0A7Z0TUJ3_9GAMM|nr:BON domain-containing protein [Luteimonas deserti]NYZ61219.1 BON domain-containing protein [Luteimonas deserti]
MRNRRDDPTGTSEMKAFGEELLATGARYIDLGRRWLAERRDAVVDAAHGASTAPRRDAHTGAAQGEGRGRNRDGDLRRDWGFDDGDGYNAVDHLGGEPDFNHFGAYDREGRVGRIQPRRPGSAGGWRGVGPKGYTRADARITEDLCEQLLHDDAIDPREISVQVRDGVVLLEGLVDQRWVKHRVEDLAERCAGVRDIDNRLRVRGMGDAPGSRTDAATEARGTERGAGTPSSGTGATADRTPGGPDAASSGSPRAASGPVIADPARQDIGGA